LLLGQERNQVCDLLGRQVGVRRWHHVLVPGLEVGAGVRDRFFDELLLRALICLLRVLRELVQVGADRGVRAGGA